MKKELLFIILAGGYQDSSLLMPQALVPLGHHPMICILLKTILGLDQEIKVHIIASLSHKGLFEKEMKRWFPLDRVEIFGSTGSTTSSSLVQFLSKQDWTPEQSFYVLQSNAPFLSHATLEHFLHVSADVPSAVLGISKTKWNEDRGLHPMVVREGRVETIGQGVWTEMGFLGASKFSMGMASTSLFSCSKYHDMVALLEEKPLFVRIASFPAELDSIQIRTTGDKTFAEHKFMERQHADYLTQCYCIWKECKTMDERLFKIEQQLSKK